MPETSWHGFPALALESERLRVVMVPGLGGKIVSLFDKTREREWLVPPMRSLKQTEYGADFVSQDMSGWDEMLPTISACEFEGQRLPDHGEVWSVPWRVERTDGEIVLSVDGTTLPYRFTRRASLVELDCLELDYALANLGRSPLPYLWAAHPQFASLPETRLLLPHEVTRVVNVMDGHPVWGPAGSIVAWPAAHDSSGERRHLDRVGPASLRACRKFYVPPEQPVSWAALQDEGQGRGLRLEWSADETPYLGLWVDEGTYNALPVAAPEPSSGYYDSLETAIKNGRVPQVQPGAEAHWTLRARLIERSH